MVRAKPTETLTETDIRVRLEKRVFECGSQSAFAKSLGVTPQYVSDILAGKRAIPDKVLAAIGVERVVSYRITKQERSNAA